MAGLYFLGIKKSFIKKLPPFKYLFDWRDRRNHRRIKGELSQKYKIEDISEKEGTLVYPVNSQEQKLIFRKFPCSDLSILHQIFHIGGYQPIVDEMLKVYDSSAPIKVVDAGANVGYSIVFFHAFFPNASIVAIEPENGNVIQLQKNVAANNFKLKDLISGELWFRHAELEVVRDFRDNREAAFTVRETTNPKGITGYGFDEILSSQQWNLIDLLKIDIEGGERFLFDTDKKADAILKRTKYLAIEIHDEFNVRGAIYGHLQRNGFVYKEFDDLTFAYREHELNVPD